jgi:sulfoxide reductase heme-binding subunit YedZ
VVAATWLPFLALGLDAARDALGANPVETLTHETGQWALRLLLASLAVTPLRRWLHAPALAPYRRSFGLMAFAYASVHFAIFLVLDLGLDPRLLVEEVAERPYVTAGFAAWALLLPLALTSNRASQRALGRRWVRLHRGVYLAVVCAVVHFLWLVKADLREPAVYAAIASVLLAVRLPGALRRRKAA